METVPKSGHQQRVSLREAHLRIEGGLVMGNYRSWIIAGTTGVCVGVLAMVGLLGDGPAPAYGQSLMDADGDEVRITYNATYINRIEVTRSGDRIRQVHLFPDTPVFLVRTRDAITVWWRDDRRLRSLLEIDLRNRSFQEVLFLEDGQSFLVHFSEMVSVYSVDRLIEEVESERNN